MSSVFGKKRKKKQTQPKAVSVIGGQKAEICSPPGTARAAGCPLFQTRLRRRTCADRRRHRQGNRVPNCVRAAAQRVRDWVPDFVEGESKGGNRAVRHRRAARFPSLRVLTRWCNTAPGPATAGGTGPLRRPPAPRGCRSGRWPRRQTPRWRRRTCSWTADG